MLNDFISAEFLATFSGIVVAINLIVQFTKNPIKKRFGDWAVRLYSFILALIITAIFTDMGEGIQGIALVVINAILLAVTSTGIYEVVSDPKAKKTL